MPPHTLDDALGRKAGLAAARSSACASVASTAAALSGGHDTSAQRSRLGTAACVSCSHSSSAAACGETAINQKHT